MGWQDTPPTQEELSLANKAAQGSVGLTKNWNDTPPTQEELAAIKPKTGIPKFMDENPMIKDITKGTLEMLPTVGGVGGGFFGGLSGGAAGGLLTFGPGTLAGTYGGAVTGAGLGGAGGKAVELLGKQYLLGEKPNAPMQNLKDIGTEGALQGAFEGVARPVGLMAGNALKMARETTPGAYIEGGLRKGAAALGDMGARFGHALTGVMPQEFKTYINHADELLSEFHGADQNMSLATDNAREKFQDAIQSTRRGLNDVIEKTIRSEAGTPWTAVESKPILDAMEKAKSTIDPIYYPEQLSQFEDVISKVKAKTKNGVITAEEAYDTVKFLQDRASSAYQKNAIFPLGSQSAFAAKKSAAVARQTLNEAVPEIAEINGKLADLHHIEDVMNKNLVKPETSDAALLAAGSGANQRNANILKRLGTATESDLLGEAQKLAAMRNFGKPELLPVDSTGKSMARQSLGRAVIGGGLGYLVGDKPGAAIGMAASSPFAARTLMDTGLLAKELAKSKVGRDLVSRGLLDKYLNEGKK